MESIDDLARAFERFPGIGPRQAKRFVYFLLSAPAAERSRLAELITSVAQSVSQCADCRRFWSGSEERCTYCTNPNRDDSTLLVVEKDQDLLALERSGSFKGRYFVLGGALTLSGKGVIRERELLSRVERGGDKLQEIVLALSATSEGEHTSEHLRALLQPLRSHLKLTILGRGLSTGSELEYADQRTLSAALQNRTET
jgi:recombination protein RecR